MILEVVIFHIHLFYVCMRVAYEHAECLIARFALFSLGWIADMHSAEEMFF